MSLVNVFSGNIVLNPYFTNIDIGGPLAFGYITRNWGWSVNSAERVHIRVPVPGPIAASPDMHITAELVGEVARAWRFFDLNNLTVDIGLGGKIFYRADWNNQVIWPNMINNITSMSFIDTYKFQTHIGLTLDAGIILTWDETFSWALSFNDFAGPALVTLYDSFNNFIENDITDSGVSEVEKKLNIGFSYRLAHNLQRTGITDFIFMLTYGGVSETFTDSPRNPLLDIKIGMEVVFLDIFRLRLGLSELLPSAGLGFDFAVYKLDLAFHLQEFGWNPGDYMGFQGGLDILFRFQPNGHDGRLPPRYL
jgi:hypothetical protein